MKLLVVGGGGREHALAWKLKQSRMVTELFCAPGNGGTEGIATSVPISADRIKALKAWARQNRIDFTVVGPEAPLASGIVNEFRAAGLKIFGVNKSAARLESSKVFSKKLLQKYGIPTAKAEVFTDFDKASDYLKNTSYPIVIKADGLAAGKGVYICQDFKEAQKALKVCLGNPVLGQAGSSVVIEQYLEGEELSYIGLVDGQIFLPLAPSQDHKRIFEGDRGPNTGGMGAYSPVPWFDASWEERLTGEIIAPLLKGLVQEDIHYRGVLYIGLMISQGQPYVLEFNVRFGDPEIQAILFRLKSDLLPLLMATAQGRLANINRHAIEWDPRPAVCVVMASQGYPDHYEKGFVVEGLNGSEAQDWVVFHAGTMLDKGKIRTAGGRVLSVVARGSNYEEAIRTAYRGVSTLNWQGAYFRKDIGYRVCQKQK